MKINESKSILIGLMKSLKMREKFIAEVVTFLRTDEEKLAMIIYLKDHMKATEDQIMETMEKIILNTRSKTRKDS